MPANRLLMALQKPERLCIGLISGTSADGVEAALCRVSGTYARVKFELVKHATFPFDRELARRIREVSTVRELSELNFELGERFADAAIALIHQAGVSPLDVDVIGSHGQTVAHLPAPLSKTPSTLQIGEASVIAERTGLPVVSDFRTRDVAAGGQGAPLVPYMDWAVFRAKDGALRALQNFGGIGNVSVVGEKLEDTLAFDTGPGNMLMDTFARRATHGELTCDLDGTLSAKGQVIPEALAQLLEHPFLLQKPPKSAGREGFGEALAAPLWEQHQDRPYDLIATALEFTVEATARAYERYILSRVDALEGVYVSGGGSRNPTLMARLTQRLSPTPVKRLDDLGFPEGAKEAACFALLASEWLNGTAQNVPAATGARVGAILGKMSP